VTRRRRSRNRGQSREIAILGTPDWGSDALSALSDSRVVPEYVLATRGYETTHLEKHQTIRQIEPLPDKKERWHPRFDLWSECFNSNDDALKRMAAKEAEIEAERAMIFKSGLGMLVRNDCVYFVSAHGTFLMLEFQPFIMRKLEEHFCSVQECTRSTQLDDL
jgi:hypothetical protein